jgi:transketolase
MYTYNVDFDMVKELEEKCVKIRKDLLNLIYRIGMGHLGGELSVVEIAVALYYKYLDYDPENPKWPDRDRVVCSKGHAGPAMYATLAHFGFFPKEWLGTLNEPHTHLPSHCDRLLTPGIDMTAGSLGQGCLVAGGMALGLKAKGSDARVFTILGDGELDEGEPWEMIAFAPSKKLNNFFAFVDRNFKQLDGYTEDIIALRDLEKQFAAFGWYTQTVRDGNDPDAIAAAIEDAKKNMDDRPAAFILNTGKGSGFKEVEEQEWNHFVTVTPEQADRGIEMFRNMLNEN